jgi:hypothetical protein
MVIDPKLEEFAQTDRQLLKLLNEFQKESADSFNISRELAVLINPENIADNFSEIHIRAFASTGNALAIEYISEEEHRRIFGIAMAMSKWLADLKINSIDNSSLLDTPIKQKLGAIICDRSVVQQEWDERAEWARKMEKEYYSKIKVQLQLEWKKPLLLNTGKAVNVKFKIVDKGVNGNLPENLIVKFQREDGNWSSCENKVPQNGCFSCDLLPNSKNKKARFYVFLNTFHASNSAPIPIAMVSHTMKTLKKPMIELVPDDK